ncbi:hypothetical protein [Clostridium sp.]|uniref:hypothetical protein n=1 Tax=Clostridium sp. TaxID=1506 RepID=UPI00290BD3F7|nr:hypothetical protein [Clostridium sp.]MDU7215714.1 hypothetical protein [Clostridium sp.]
MIYIYCNNNGSVRQFMPFVDFLKKRGIEHEQIINLNCINLFKNESLNKYKHEIESMSREDIFFIVGNYVEFFQVRIFLWKNKYNNINIIYRARGIIGEESFIKNNSIIKLKILNIIEKYVLKKSYFILTVSEKQKIHYRNKYGINENKMYTIHNYSSYENISSDIEGNFLKEVVYVGGASKWQQTEKVSEIFKFINDRDKGIRFLICTNESDMNIIEERFSNITNVEIVSLEYDDLIKRISKSTAGIIFRDDSIVNKVSSPFKIIDYFNANLPIIMTETIGDYNDILRDKGFIKIIQFRNINIDQKENIYTFINEMYASREKYAKEIDNFKREYLSIDKEIDKIIDLL